MVLRRSSRLIEVFDLGASAATEPPLVRKRETDTISAKRRLTLKHARFNTDADDHDGCNDPDVRDGDNGAPAAPTTSAELSKRERTLLRRERDLRINTELLAKQQVEIERAEKALGERSAEVALSQLEDHFLCPLCFDILACPYMLTPARCGHTFCALCIVKWFFSRLHRGCGGWHESVDCPMCRALLILTPDAVPRSSITVPFAPNRVADKVLGELVRRLGNRRPPRVGSGVETGGCGRDVKKEATTSSSIEDWAEGGALRTEWLERNRLGRQEMDDIIGRWKTLSDRDFVAIKDRLGV